MLSYILALMKKLFSKQQDLLQGSISGHMLRMALPSIGGVFSITIFNLTDTYFVSKLGTNALAAMGFTFPVVMLVGAIFFGHKHGCGIASVAGQGR